MPSPKWKLVVDVTYAPPPAVPDIDASNHGVDTTNTAENVRDETISEIITMLGQHMPSNPNSSLASYCQAFISLRLLLLRPTRTQAEEDTVRIITGSYRSYKSSGRSPVDICIMLACDFQFLQQAHSKLSVPTNNNIKSESAKNMPQYVFTKNNPPPTDFFSHPGRKNSPPLSSHSPHQQILDNVSIIST